jgi:hypothetical protein
MFGDYVVRPVPTFVGKATGTSRPTAAWRTITEPVESGAVWAALLGAIVGGLLSLVGTMAVELRIERRRQLGGARLVLSQLDRAVVELGVLSDEAESWLDGPHENIRTDAWDASGVDFVGRLSRADFDLVDRFYTRLARAGEWGLTQADLSALAEQAVDVGVIIGLQTEPTWFDRHVWRL